MEYSFKDPSVRWCHACAVRDDNSLVCWGTDTGYKTKPSEKEFVQVSCGFTSTCALRIDSPLLPCFGFNVFTVVEPNEYAHVTVSERFACGLRKNQRVACWGYDASPVVGVEGVENVVQITAGINFFCALDSDSVTRCFIGANNVNQLNVIS